MDFQRVCRLLCGARARFGCPCQVYLAIATVLLVVAYAVPQVYAQQAFEKAPTFSASKVIPSHFRRGSNFRVNEKVLSDGYLFLITLYSDYGTYKVRGLQSLKTRVYELSILEVLEEFTDSKVFLDAAKDAGVDILLAPVHGVKRVVHAVENPEETWETVKKVPSGIGRLFGDVVDAVDTGLTKAGNFVRDQTSSKKSEKDKAAEREKLGDKATEQATELGLDYIGFSDRESEWYNKYNLDQFTTNKPLRDKITRIAAVQAAVKLGSRFLPGIGQLKYISELNRGLSMAERLSLYKSPEEQRKKNHGVLVGMQIAPAIIEAFLSNPQFSPSESSRLVIALEKFPGAKNRQAVVADAAACKSREVALVFVQAMEFLAQRFPSTSAFLSEGSLPLAVVSPGRVISPLALDYVSWTKEVAAGATQIRAAATRAGHSHVELHLSGKVSSRCREELRKIGVSVQEGVLF